MSTATPSSASSQFALETSVTEIAPNVWSAHLSQAWNINANPNGGYALSLLLRAMKSGAPDHPDPVSTSSHFLRPCLGDEPAEISIEVVRTGRRTSTVRGELRQDGKPRLVALATLADLDQWGTNQGASDLPDSGVTGGVGELVAPTIPDPDDCPQRDGDTQGVSLPLLSRVEVRIDPAYSQPGSSDQAIMQGWIRLADGAPTTVDCLPLFADCFPPSMFSRHGQIGWVPTVELTVHARRRPEPGWIQARFETSDLGQGLIIEDGILWDEQANVVAQSRQLALVLSDA